MQLRGGDDGNGAGGTEYLKYFLLNTGARCTLYGYPGVSVLDSDGHIVQQAASRNPRIFAQGSPHLVTLRRGERAEFVLAMSQTDPNPQCPGQRRGGTLRVYPPNQKLPLYLKGTFEACELAVTAVWKP